MERQLSRIGHLSSPDPKVWRAYAALARVSPSYSPLQGRLPTCYSPVRRSTRGPKATFALDLHVSGTPPAFILSQDQTLQLNPACARSPWLSHARRAPLLRHWSPPGTNGPGGLYADARPGGMTARPRHRRGVVSLSDVIFDGRRGRRGIDADSSSIQFSKNRPFVAAGPRGPKRGVNAASRPARVPRWAAPLEAPSAVPLSEGEDASGATPAVSTPRRRFLQSAGGPNRTRRPSIRQPSVNRRRSASGYSSCSCRRMRLARESTSSPLRTSTAR